MDPILYYFILFLINWCIGFAIIGTLWKRSATVRAWFDAIDRMANPGIGQMLFIVFIRIFVPTFWIIPLAMYYIVEADHDTFNRHDHD